MSDDSNDNKPKINKGKESSDLFKKFQNFSLREKIGEVRVKVTSSLLSVVPTKMIPLPDETMFDVVKKPLYEASEYCQSNFPYVATVSRSHASEIIAANTIGGALFSLKFLPRKYFVLNTLATSLYSAVSVSVVNFVWYFPKDGKSE